MYSTNPFARIDSRYLVQYLAILIICLSVTLPATAQTDESEAPIEVLVLGTFHFKYAPDHNPIDAPEQQREIKALNESLLKFKPTKVALEFERNKSDLVDSLYQAYLQGKHQLTVNERQQVGFRIAQEMDHSKVYSIDYVKPWGMGPAIEWAKKNQPEFVEFFNEWQRNNDHVDSVMHANKTIPEILRFYNEETLLGSLQEARMKYLEVGAGENYIGVKPLASVYERNMRIFANLIEIAKPGDRILIVYGAGHTYFFHRFIEQHPDMKLVPVANYL